MGCTMKTEPVVTEEQSGSLGLFKHLVDELFVGRDYGDKTGTWSCCCGRSFVEQVGLESGLSWEQEKHFRYENGQCSFSEVGVDERVGVGVPFGD